MTRVLSFFACATVISGCTEMGPQVSADELRTRLTGQKVQLRPDGGPKPGEPEAFNMTFRANGALTVEPVGSRTAVVRDGDVTIRFPLGFDGAWDVRDGELCIGMQRRLDCQPATVSGDILVVTDRDSGDTARGRLQPTR